MGGRYSRSGLRFRSSQLQNFVCGSNLCMRRGSCGTQRTGARSATATDDSESHGKEQNADSKNPPCRISDLLDVIRDTIIHLHPRLCTKSRSACEAGVSIKPGAQAPGSDHKNKPEPVKRVTARNLQAFARCRGLRPLLLVLEPGACAPGFMLTPAIAG
jgi:hypothetical protein